MRALTEKEIELVAGGYRTGWSSGTRNMTTFFSSFAGGASGSPIIVRGHRYIPLSDIFFTYSQVTGGGTGGATPPPPAPPEPKDTPCVPTANAPTAASLHDVNQQALEASNEISHLNNSTFEYGSIIYVLNGVIGHTDPFTQKSTDSIDWNAGVAMVPNGATIVGILHNHPDEPGIDDTIPSPTAQGGHDWEAYDSFLALNTRGIHADPNLLMYIYSNEDNKTHVYDKGDRQTTHSSCTLQ
jgi:hypothetical protein